MKIIVSVILMMFLWNVPVKTQDNIKRDNHIQMLELSGKVKEIRLITGENGTYTPVVISLDMKLVNKGTVPIILLRKNPSCLNASIAKTVEDLNTETNTFSSYNLAFSPNFVDATEWMGFKQELNKDAPPSNMTTVLDPETPITYKYDLRLNLPPEESRSNSFRREMSLKQLKELKSVFLRFSSCDFRNYGIESEASKDRTAFAKRLQKKWEKYGSLWLDSMDSEPILLDFNSAIIKTSET